MEDMAIFFDIFQRIMKICVQMECKFQFLPKKRESRIFVTPSFSVCRGKRIRTFDPLLPKQNRTLLYPFLFASKFIYLFIYQILAYLKSFVYFCIVL